MIKLVVFVTIVCASSAFGAPTENGRIIGGHEAVLGQFPHQISMQINRQHFCGGSILNPTKILTAAHCVYGQNGAMEVVAGIDNLQQTGQRVSVAKAVYHGMYNPKSLLNDIAILILSSPLTYDTNVQPVTLATSKPIPGSVLTLSGWGYIKYPPTETAKPNQLQTIDLVNIDLNQCASMMQGFSPIGGGHVCTVSAPGTGACKGDSGGPLIDQAGVQVGVVSWGIPCAIGYPDIFTSVIFYRDFIDAIN